MVAAKHALFLLSCTALFTGGIGVHRAAAASPKGPPAADSETPSPKELCNQNYVDAQQLSRDGKLLEASGKYLACQQPQCGEVVASECLKSFESLDASIPTLVFAVFGKKQAELHTVTISIDGSEVTRELRGSAFKVNPGVHTVRVEATGLPVQEQELMVRAGDRNRVVEFRLVSEPTPTPVAPVTQAAPRPIEVSGYEMPTLGWILGGVGVTGIAAGGVLQFFGNKKYTDLEASCAPNCSEREVDKAKSLYQYSYISFGVGAASLVATGVVVLTLGKHTEQVPAMAAVPLPGGGAASVRFSF
jgi:hypothetical protein